MPTKEAHLSQVSPFLLGSVTPIDLVDHTSGQVADLYSPALREVELLQCEPKPHCNCIVRLSNVAQDSQINNGTLIEQDIPRFGGHFPGAKIKGETLDKTDS